MLRIANYLEWNYEDKLEVKFFHYGGARNHKYQHLLEETQYEVFKLQPEWKNVGEIEKIYQISRGEIYDDLIDTELIENRVKSELGLYQKLRPNLVITGMVLSAKLSTQIANVPYFFVSSGLVFLDLEYYFPFVLPNLNYYTNRILYYFLRKVTFGSVWSSLANVFRETSVKFGVFPKIRNFVQIIEGDKVLVADIPETIRLPNSQMKKIFSENHEYVGPIFAELPKPIPSELSDLIDGAKRNNKKILYLSMGSSGKQNILMSILSELSQRMKNGEFPSIGLVISPTKRILSKIFYLIDEEDEVDDRTRSQNSYFQNVFLQSFGSRFYFTEPNLPAHTLNEKCDLAVLHGGLGTVQCAASSGLPFVGIPFQSEQRGNVERMVRHHGTAIIVTEISDERRTGKEVVDQLKFMLDNLDEFSEKAGQAMKVYQKYDSMKTISELIFEELSS